MNKISKILVILLISVVCILASSGESWGAEVALRPLQELIEKLGVDVSIVGDTVSLSGTTGVEDIGNSTVYTVERADFTFSDKKTYTYCISRGVGNGYYVGDKWVLGKSGQYVMRLFIRIDKQGIFYNSVDGGDFGHHIAEVIYKIDWDKAKNYEIAEAAKKMYYILSARG